MHPTLEGIIMSAGAVVVMILLPFVARKRYDRELQQFISARQRRAFKQSIIWSLVGGEMWGLALVTGFWWPVVFFESDVMNNAGLGIAVFLIAFGSLASLMKFYTEDRVRSEERREL